MPQLTPDCDRVIIIALPPSDGMEFNTLNLAKLFQMVMEIRISEDYWSSDVYITDFANMTLRHITKITPSFLKKFEICAFVSSTHIFCVYKNNRV